MIFISFHKIYKLNIASTEIITIFTLLTSRKELGYKNRHVLHAVPQLKRTFSNSTKSNQRYVLSWLKEAHQAHWMPYALECSSAFFVWTFSQMVLHCSLLFGNTLFRFRRQGSSKNPNDSKHSQANALVFASRNNLNYFCIYHVSFAVLPPISEKRIR